MDKSDRAGIRGQALVEFVLVAPLLLTILFGIIAYGLYINAANTVSAAARVGARSAVIGETFGCPGNSAAAALATGQSPTVYGEVDDQLAHGGLPVHPGSGAPLPVISYGAVLTNSGNTAQDNVEITIAYPYHPPFTAFGLLSSTIMIAQTYQMMVQTAQPAGGLQSTLPTGKPYEETAQYTHPAPPSSNVQYLVQPSGC